MGLGPKLNRSKPTHSKDSGDTAQRHQRERDAALSAMQAADDQAAVDQALFERAWADMDA